MKQYMYKLYHARYKLLILTLSSLFLCNTVFLFINKHSLLTLDYVRAISLPSFLLLWAFILAVLNTILIRYKHWKYCKPILYASITLYLASAAYQYL